MNIYAWVPASWQVVTSCAPLVELVIKTKNIMIILCGFRGWSENHMYSCMSLHVTAANSWTTNRITDKEICYEKLVVHFAEQVEASLVRVTYVPALSTLANNEIIVFSRTGSETNNTSNLSATPFAEDKGIVVGNMGHFISLQSGYFWPMTNALHLKRENHMDTMLKCLPHQIVYQMCLQSPKPKTCSHCFDYN